MKRRAVLAAAILIVSIVLTINVPQPKPTNLPQMLPPSSQSYLVSKLAKKGIGGAALIVVSDKPYSELPDEFGYQINETLKKCGSFSSMDYFTLKKYVFNKLNNTITDFVIKNYKYITYLKDLVEQLDGIGIYVYDTVQSAWNIYELAKHAPSIYKSYKLKWNEFVSYINKVENEFLQKEQLYSVETSYYVFKASQLLNKALSVVLAFNETRSYYVSAYRELSSLINEYCSKGKFNVRKIAENLSKGSGYEGLVKRLMAQALISTWIGWQGKPCSNKGYSPDFLTAVLAYFVSLAPQALSEAAENFNLTKQEMKNIVLLATTLSPNASPKEVRDALLESIRVTLRLSTDMAAYVLNSLHGDREAFASLVVALMRISDPCLTKAVFESVLYDRPLVLTSLKCEVEVLRNALARAPGPYDPRLLESSLARRGLDERLASYEALFGTLYTLSSKGIPLNVSLALVYGRMSPQEALKRYLELNEVIYPDCILRAVTSSSRLVEAQRKSVFCVYKKLAREMTNYGFSASAVNTMIYSLMALGPGLSSEQVNEVVYKTLLTELNNLKDPRLELLNSIMNLKGFLRKLVWSKNVEEAISSIENDVKNATSAFIHKYVALSLLVGKDGKHLVFLLPKDPNELPRLPVKFFYVSPRWINEEIKRSTMHDIDFVNKVGTVLVFLALLLSVKSLKLSLIPVLIIYVVLQYFKLVLVGLEALGLKPTNIDIVVATATILGMGIDYSLFTAARYKRGKFLEAIRPVIIAASLASSGFALFGLVSALFLPGLKTLGVFVPLAIMFTATVGPSITVLFKEILGIKSSEKPNKVPLITSLSADMPRTVLFFTILIVIVSAYLLISKPPGYDLYLFLPKDSESLKALRVLQEYSSPGVIGPTVVALKIKTHNMVKVAKEVEALARYFVESGYFNYAFTYTRPLGEFVSTDPKVLELVGGNAYLKGDWVFIYLLPSYPPDSSTMVDHIGSIRKFLARWIVGKPFEEALVGGESAVNYDISVTVNNITLHYVIPIMTILTILIFVFFFRKMEIVISASATSLISMIAALGLSIFIISVILKMTTLWIVVPLTITVVLSVGSDYSVFYFFGLKRALEECKILIGKECAHKMNAVYYNASTMFNLILGFATTFAVAYFSLLASNIWALRELGISLGFAPLLLVTALFTLVPAILALIWE